MPVTAPATPEAQQWNGFGTALKPAHEPIIVARKPLSEPTIAANVLRWGTGALNIKAGRIGLPEEKRAAGSRRYAAGKLAGGMNGDGELQSAPHDGLGRWPANLILSHSPGCAEGCTPDCPVALMDRQSGERPGMARGILRRGASTGRGMGYAGSSPQEAEAGYSDTGTASRFFYVTEPEEPFLYCAKASKSERNGGCEGLESRTRNRVNPGGLEHDPKWAPVEATNHHPTLKPVSLMAYLVGLCCPPGGIVLDPFMGSGSTGVACIVEGFQFLGIEREGEFAEIARARIDAARRGRKPKARKPAPVVPGQGSLFGEE